MVESIKAEDPGISGAMWVVNPQCQLIRVQSTPNGKKRTTMCIDKYQNATNESNQTMGLWAALSAQWDKGKI